MKRFIIVLLGILLILSLVGCGGEKDDDAGDEGAAAEANIAEVIVAKNRHGETGTVQFAWDGEHTLFLQLEKIHDD